MSKDKKATGGKVPLILVRGIGRAYIETDVSEAELLELWRGTGRGSLQAQVRQAPPGQSGI